MADQQGDEGRSHRTVTTIDGLHGDGPTGRQSHTTQALVGWDGFSDPGQELGAETTAAIGSVNEPCWSKAEYDKLRRVQETTLDLRKRKAYIWRMQQIMYEQTPWMVLTYPHHLEVYNTAKWTGWTRLMNGSGPAFYWLGTWTLT